MLPSLEKHCFRRLRLTETPALRIGPRVDNSSRSGKSKHPHPNTPANLLAVGGWHTARRATHGQTLLWAHHVRMAGLRFGDVCLPASGDCFGVAALKYHFGALSFVKIFGTHGNQKLSGLDLPLIQLGIMFRQA